MMDQAQWSMYIDERVTDASSKFFLFLFFVVVVLMRRREAIGRCCSEGLRCPRRSQVPFVWRELGGRKQQQRQTRAHPSLPPTEPPKEEEERKKARVLYRPSSL